MKDLRMFAINKFFKKTVKGQPEEVKSEVKEEPKVVKKTVKKVMKK